MTLADDGVFVADSAGKAPVGLKPVCGQNSIAPGMVGFLRLTLAGIWAWLEDVNGQPAIVEELDGRLCGMLICEIADRQVTWGYTGLNPDKHAGKKRVCPLA